MGRFFKPVKENKANAAEQNLFRFNRLRKDGNSSYPAVTSGRDGRSYILSGKIRKWLRGLNLRFRG
jgi:hypothetical protein